MSVNNYHGFFAHYFGDPDAKARPTSWAAPGDELRQCLQCRNFAGETGRHCVLDHPRSA